MTVTATRLVAKSDRRGAPIVCLGRRPAATTLLACFHHAGGGPMAFRGWAEHLDPDVELWAATLPGRAGRRHEPFARDWDTLVDDFSGAIVEKAPEALALFGHSLGAVVAFEVARSLEHHGLPPVQLVVSGREAPDVPIPFSVPSTDAELLAQVERVYGGIPRAVAAEPELLRHFLPILRADLELASAYVYRPGPALGCRISAFAGDADRTVAAKGLAGWRRQTDASFTLHRLPGGHLFVYEHVPAVLAKVNKRDAAREAAR